MRNEYTYNLYGKAQVDVKEDNIAYNELLYSYDTLVGLYTKDKITGREIFNYLGKYSQTTTRYQKEFFRQKGLTDKELITLFKTGILEK